MPWHISTRSLRTSLAGASFDLSYTDPTLQRRYLIIIINLKSHKQEAYEIGENKNTQLMQLHNFNTLNPSPKEKTNQPNTFQNINRELVTVGLYCSNSEGFCGTSTR